MPANVPGSASSARRTAAPPDECPKANGCSRPSPCTTASASSAKPCQEKSPSGGGSEGPCARWSTATQCNLGVSRRAKGDSAPAQKPVAWTSSSAGPSPPKSYQATRGPLGARSQPPGSITDGGQRPSAALSGSGTADDVTGAPNRSAPSDSQVPPRIAP